MGDHWGPLDHHLPGDAMRGVEGERSPLASHTSKNVMSMGEYELNLETLTVNPAV